MAEAAGKLISGDPVLKRAEELGSSAAVECLFECGPARDEVPGTYALLDLNYFLKRTPTPPPFSGMNRIPAFSNAAIMLVRLLLMGTCTPRSKSAMV